MFLRCKLSWLLIVLVNRCTLTRSVLLTLDSDTAWQVGLLLSAKRVNPSLLPSRGGDVKEILMESAAVLQRLGRGNVDTLQPLHHVSDTESILWSG